MFSCLQSQQSTMQLPEACMVQKRFLYSIIKEKIFFSSLIYLLECNTIFYAGQVLHVISNSASHLSGTHAYKNHCDKSNSQNQPDMI
jgi:hypothetical protein